MLLHYNTSFLYLCQLTCLERVWFDDVFKYVYYSPVFLSPHLLDRLRLPTLTKSEETYVYMYGKASRERSCRPGKTKCTVSKIVEVG